MNVIKGIACKDRLTKILIQRISKKHIAVIKHKAVDLVAAQDLKYKKVKAVINCECSIASEYNLDGIKYLIDNNIRVFDAIDKNFFDIVNDGDFIYLCKDCIFVNNLFCTYYREIKQSDIVNTDIESTKEHQERKRQFVINTMHFMNLELDYFISSKELPELDTVIKNREVFIIARGRNYREDLKSVKRFILNKKPVIISVDGGADAVTDMGLKNNIIIGDMDSVSYNSLFNCNEIIVHSYSNGHAPGLNRIKAKGLDYKLISIKGTSEDAALYMAKMKGASTIYLIGGHNSVDEFLEKDRSGMGSTVLLRLLVGPKIIDLKGVSNIAKLNRINPKKLSLILLITFIGFITLFFNGILGQYIQKNLDVLFNAY